MTENKEKSPEEILEEVLDNPFVQSCKNWMNKLVEDSQVQKEADNARRASSLMSRFLKRPFNPSKVEVYTPRVLSYEVQAAKNFGECATVWEWNQRKGTYHVVLTLFPEKTGVLYREEWMHAFLFSQLYNSSWSYEASDPRQHEVWHQVQHLEIMIDAIFTQAAFNLGKLEIWKKRAQEVNRKNRTDFPAEFNTGIYGSPVNERFQLKTEGLMKRAKGYFEELDRVFVEKLIDSNNSDLQELYKIFLLSWGSGIKIDDELIIDQDFLIKSIIDKENIEEAVKFAEKMLLLAEERHIEDFFVIAHKPLSRKLEYSDFSQPENEKSFGIDMIIRRHENGPERPIYIDGTILQEISAGRKKEGIEAIQSHNYHKNPHW